MEKNPSTITIGPVRFSHLHLWEPQAINEGDTKKYSVSAIIPKTDKALVKKIQDAIETAKQAGKDSKFGGKFPANLKMPLRDGDIDRAEDEAYQNSFFIGCNATTKPGAVDANRSPIMNQDDIYSGAYGYLNVSFYAFSAGGSKGVAVGFNHIMMTSEGERLSGKISVDSAFDDVDIDANSLL